MTASDRLTLHLWLARDYARRAALATERAVVAAKRARATVAAITVLR